MKHIIFYSWQSDVDPALTRNFIEDALGRAVKSIMRAEETSIEAVVDRDTAGVAGTPGIAETIFQKIAACDVFVCDISTINEVPGSGLLSQIARAITHVLAERTFAFRTARRPTPNPNVLLELGYAVACLGWERVILVKNTAFGKIEDLPFDLSGRRIVPFHLSTKDARSEERPALRDRLEAALRRALANMLALTDIRLPGAQLRSGKTMPRWFGFWHTPRDPARGSTLFIREVGAAGFFFHLSLTDGARTGSVGGLAKFTGPNSAYAWISTADETQWCELKFRRTLGDIRQVHVEESRACSRFKGLGATFDGMYTCDVSSLFGDFDEMDLQRLYSVTGQYYQPLVERFQLVGHEESIDKFPARVTVGGAKGLFLDFGGIVMLGEYGQIWAAYVDDQDVRYFTTEQDYKEKLPATIERWRANVRNRPVIYVNDVKLIPNF